MDIVKDPHFADIAVGRKLKERRLISGISQEELGKAIGVTFQQIQKYEKGLNRISASKLYEIAEILNVDINFFFESLCSPNDNKIDLSNKIDEKEIINLLRSYTSISNESVRKKLFALIKSLNNEQEKFEE